MKTPDKIYISFLKGIPCRFDLEPNLTYNQIEYINKETLLEWVKLAYGKVSMNPFDCQDVFEELINKINSL